MQTATKVPYTSKADLYIMINNRSSLNSDKLKS